MSSAGIVVGVVLTLIVLAIVVAPFFSGRRQTQATGETLDELQAHYERVLTNIKDLDEDHALGKITDDFYQTERRKFTAEGVHLLQAMDAATPDDTPTKPETADLDTRIEAAVASKRKQAT